MKGKILKSHSTATHFMKSKSSPSCAFAFQPHHLYQYLQTKATIQAVEFRHYKPRIIHNLCSSNCVTCALLIYSNKVMLLSAIRLLVTSHRKQFFLFCELTLLESARNTDWPEGNLFNALIIHKRYHLFFLCCIIPHQKLSNKQRAMHNT